MPVTQAYQLNSMWIDTDAVADTTIGGIVRQTINTGVEIIKEMSSGSQYPEAAYVSGSSPNAAISTTHCEELLTEVGVRSLCITSATNSGVHLWARKLECSQIATGSSHEQYTFRNGIVIPTALNCDHQGNASVDVSILGVETDSLAAMVVTASAAISASTAINTDRWTLQGALIGGVTLAAKKNVSVNFGNTPLLESGDDDKAPTFASVQETAPTITFRGIDPAAWWSASGGLAGVACTHANTEVWLKQRGIDVGTLAHIKITMNGLAYIQQAYDSSGQSTGEVDLQIDGTEDGSSAPLVIAVNQAIS